MNRYREAEQDANRFQRRIVYLREQVEKLTGQQGGSKPQTAAHNSIAGIVSALAEEERQTWEKVERAQQIRREVAAMIDALPDERQRTVMEAYYLQSMSWGEVGNSIDRSENTVRRLRNNALAEIEGMLAEQRRGAAANDE
jgi:RNA polymerase sigma factor (sigma-70 family)